MAAPAAASAKSTTITTTALKSTVTPSLTINVVAANKAAAQQQPLMMNHPATPAVVGSTNVGAAATAHPLQLQALTQSKMTKKQLKLAQAQLDKLTQINIHLHGTYEFLFFYNLYLFLLKLFSVRTKYPFFLQKITEFVNCGYNYDLFLHCTRDLTFMV